MAALDQEELWVLILDTRNHLVEVDKVYRGSLHTTVIRVGELFKNAVRRNAAAVVITHNHPSGNPSPSPEDVRLTELTGQAGKLLDIDVLDHIIVGKNGRYVSLKERGLGFHR